MVRARRPLRPTGCGATTSSRTASGSTYGRVLREVPRYYQTDVLTSKATQFIRRRARRRRAVLPVGRVPRPAPRVGQHAAAHREARAPGAAPSRALRAHAAPEAAELQRGRPRRQAVVRRALEPRHHPAARGGDPQAHARALGSRCRPWTTESRTIIGALRRHRRARQHLRDLHLRPRLHAGGAPDTAGQDGAVRPLDPGPAADSRPGHPARPHHEGAGGRRRPRADDPGRHACAAVAPARRPLDPAVRAQRQAAQPPAVAPHHRRPGRAGANQHARGRHARDAAARARLERGANNALALRRVQGRPAGALRPEERPLAAQLRDRRPALGRPHPQEHAATNPRRPRSAAAGESCDTAASASVR